MVDCKKLEQHIKLCKRNLKNKRVKCCGNCPFEEEIKSYDPGLLKYFSEKRRQNEDSKGSFETSK